MKPPTLSSLKLLALVKERLSGSGWEVRQGYCDEYFNIDLEHPLTSPYGFAFANDDEDHAEFVDSILGQREFRVLAEFPQSSDDRKSLLRQIRVSAQVGAWDAEIVTTLARILKRYSIIGEAEAEWLENAGPSWSE